MKVVSTEALTKLIQLIKGSFISNTDTETTSEVTLAAVATSGSYNDLSDKPTIPTVDQTYDGTSTNAQSGVAVASAISGKADDSAVVHLTGDETITGGKTFTSNIIHKNTKATISNPPTSNSWLYTDFIDNNNARIGVIGSVIKPNGSRGTYLQAGNEGDVSILSNGSNAWATAPASDVNGSIVTTVSKTKASTGYFKLGNGLIIQWGSSVKSTAGSNNLHTITFPSPFSTTIYFANATLVNGSSQTDSWGEVVNRSSTSCDFVVKKDYTFTWIAIGY